VLGLRSAGLHANGFTLVRSLIGTTVTPDLLCRDHLLLDDVRELRERAEIHALATSPARYPGESARVLPPGLARSSRPSWQRGAVYDWISEKGVSEEEQRRVFNLGIGYCVVIPESDVSPDDS